MEKLFWTNQFIQDQSVFLAILCKFHICVLEMLLIRYSNVVHIFVTRSTTITQLSTCSRKEEVNRFCNVFSIKKETIIPTMIPQNGFSSIRYTAFQWKHNISKELSKTYHLSFINNFNQKKKRKKRVNLNIYSKKPNEQWWKHQIPLSCLSCQWCKLHEPCWWQSTPNRPRVS